MFRHALRALLVATMVALVPATAHAAEPPTPWLLNPSGTANVGAYGNLWAEPGKTLSLTFGASTGATQVTVKIPTFHDMYRTTDTPGCAVSGHSATCSGESGAASLHVPAGTPLGYAGFLLGSTAGSTHTVSMPLWIVDTKRGADLDVTTGDAVGDTVTIDVDVRNQGPSPEPYFELTDIGAPHLAFVGASGCTARHGTTCEYHRFVAVGQNVAIHLKLKIVAASPAGWDGRFALSFFLTDPNTANLDETFHVRPGTTDGGVNSGAGGAPAVVPTPTGTTSAPAATPTATPSASDTPVAAVGADPTDGAAAAVVPAASTTGGVGGWVSALAAILVVAGAALAVTVYRRRRPDTAPEAVE